MKETWEYLNVIERATRKAFYAECKKMKNGNIRFYVYGDFKLVDGILIKWNKNSLSEAEFDKLFKAYQPIVQLPS